MNPDSSLGLYLTASNEEECGVVADTTTNMTIKIRCHQRSLHPKRLRLNRSVKNLFRGILTGCRIIKIKISSPTSNILVSLLLALTSKTIKGGFFKYWWRGEKISGPQEANSSERNHAVVVGVFIW